jgi:hypothetical protein
MAHRIRERSPRLAVELLQQAHDHSGKHHDGGDFHDLILLSASARRNAIPEVEMLRRDLRLPAVGRKCDEAWRGRGQR